MSDITPPVCGCCRRERTGIDRDYNPLQVFRSPEEAHAYAQLQGDKVVTEQNTVETVVAGAGTRLEQLQAAYVDAKAEADAATAHLKTITDGLKVELSQAAPEGVARIELAAGAGPALRLSYSESWRVDARKLKAEDPLTYARYAKKSGSWSLRVVAGGES